MGNHYHLLIRSREGRLADGMKWLSGRYTQRINYREGRDSPVFRGRYTSVSIESDAHLVLVSRYIHLIPLDARVTQRPEDWRWSSAQYYVNAMPGPDWLHVDLVLAMFGPQSTRAAYCKFLDAGIDTKTRAAYSKLLSR